MAIQQVRAKLNGTWHTLTYDSASGKYKATVTAPGATSYHQTGGYYNVEVEATNTAGTTATASGTSVPGLRLVVRERVPPVITILSPTSGAYVTNSNQPVIFTLLDEAGGSGINLSTISVKLDGVTAGAGALATTAIANGYSVTFTPPTAMSDGTHTVLISCSDNDGNAAVSKSTTFTVDTVPPTLNISAPTDGQVVANTALTVRGTTNDVGSSPVTVTVSVNGTAQGNAAVSSDGSFTKPVTLVEGNNTIVVTAVDAAGQSSSVTRAVTLDTSVPVITSAQITPNPVDAGATMIVSVVIE